MGSLLPELPGQRLGWLAAGYQRQVIGHYIDRYGRGNQYHADPEGPAAMHAFPVRAFVAMNALVPLAFVPGASVVRFTYSFPAIASSSSIAAEYCPRRAARLQTARWLSACCAADTFASLPCQISIAGC